jgi:hypothetical protein
MEHFSLFLAAPGKNLPVRDQKKRRRYTPASRYCFRTDNDSRKENAALPDSVGCSGVDGSVRVGRLLSINFGVRFQFVQSFENIFLVDCFLSLRHLRNFAWTADEVTLDHLKNRSQLIPS